MIDLYRNRVLALAVVVGAAAMLVGVRHAHAQGRAAQPAPVTGAWCGLADAGGAVRMEVSSDGRFVESISIDSDRGTISSSEGTVVVPRAQIAEEKFIFRGGDTERDRCEPTRCQGPNCLPGASGRNRPGTGGGRCSENPTSGIMIRGTFLSPDYVKGNFTGVIPIEVQPGNGPGNSGARVVSRRVVGNYVAWPAGVAPCP